MKITDEDVKRLAAQAKDAGQLREAGILYALAGAMCMPGGLHTLYELTGVATRINTDTARASINEINAKQQ